MPKPYRKTYLENRDKTGRINIDLLRLKYDF